MGFPRSFGRVEYLLIKALLILKGIYHYWTYVFCFFLHGSQPNGSLGKVKSMIEQLITRLKEQARTDFFLLRGSKGECLDGSIRPVGVCFLEAMPRANFHVHAFSGILLSRKPPNPWGHGDRFLKRTMAENNSESTPRMPPLLRMSHLLKPRGDEG